MDKQEGFVEYVVIFLVVVLGLGAFLGISAFIGKSEVLEDCHVTRAVIDIYQGAKGGIGQVPKIFTDNCGAFEIPDDLFGKIEEGKTYDFVVGIDGIREVL